ncbi:MAG: hypothetical protein ACC608_09485 [Anaerofustis sp.]
MDKDHSEELKRMTLISDAMFTLNELDPNLSPEEQRINDAVLTGIAELYFSIADRVGIIY